MSPVPLLDLKAQYRTIQEELDSALMRVVKDQRFILGPEVEAFEEELARYLGVKHAVGVSSGTDALITALLALGIGPGDEVITTAYSFFATAGSIARCGARPVFVDIDRSLNLDPFQVAARVTPHTRAIMPVHLFGRCAQMAALGEAAPGIPLVEDAAQAIGATLAGRHAGGLGSVGCFSFFPSKNLGGYGDGGMVTTDDPELARRIRALRVHGQLGGDRYQHDLMGGNFRLDAIQAAILRVKLQHLEEWISRRRSHARQYRELFEAAGLDPSCLVCPPADPPAGRHVYNQFVIQVERRDALREHLLGQGIGNAIYYPRGLHQQPCFTSLGSAPGDYPRTEEAAARSLAIPIYAELSESQVSMVASTIIDFYTKRR